MVPIEPRLQTLFLAFLRLGATAYGGPAMMAYLRQECVGKRQWLTEQDFKEGMALCHTIPGATMMQMTTYMGFWRPFSECCSWSRTISHEKRWSIGRPGH